MVPQAYVASTLENHIKEQKPVQRAVEWGNRDKI